MSCNKITKLPALISNISIKYIFLFFILHKNSKCCFKKGYQENSKLMKSQIGFRNFYKPNALFQWHKINVLKGTFKWFLAFKSTFYGALRLQASITTELQISQISLISKGKFPCIFQKELKGWRQLKQDMRKPVKEGWRGEELSDPARSCSFD